MMPCGPEYHNVTSAFVQSQVVLFYWFVWGPHPVIFRVFFLALFSEIIPRYLGDPVQFLDACIELWLASHKTSALLFYYCSGLSNGFSIP